MDWGRIALLIVPGLAGATSAAVLLGPGEPRPVDGARAATAARRGATRAVVAIHTVRHEDGLFAPRVGLPLEVAIRDAEGRERGRWAGRSDDEGDAIAELDVAPLAHGATLVVTGPTGVLLEAAMPLLAEPIAVVPRPWSLFRGDLEARLRIVRGVLVPEMPERVEVEVRADDVPRLFVDVVGGEASAVGTPATRCDPDCAHRWTFDVTSKAPTTMLRVRATLPTAEATLETLLPLAPGAFWPSPDAGSGEAIRIRAPGPRDAAWVFLTTPDGWHRGEKVKMDDDRGFATGLAPPWPWPDGPRSLVLASGPLAPPEQAVGWPLGDAEAIAPAQGVTLADPMPELVAAEAQRANRARWPAIASIIAAALFTFIELARRTRRSQSELEAHLSRQLGGAATEKVQSRTALWWLVVVCGGLALAFVALAVLTAYAPT